MSKPMITVETKMSAAMYSELHSLVAKEPALCEVALCEVSRDGYLRNHKYVGVLEAGERVHRIDTEYGVTYVRSRCRAPQLRKLFR